MATVFERVRKIIVDQLGVEEDQVVPSASFVDDSQCRLLDLVELIMSMEEEFSKDGKTLEISDEDAEKIATVQDAVDYLKDWRRGRRSPPRRTFRPTEAGSSPASLLCPPGLAGLSVGSMGDKRHN